MEARRPATLVRCGPEGKYRSALLLALLLLVPSGTLGQEPFSVWPTLHGGAARAGAAAVPGPRRPSVFWRLPFVQYVNAAFRSPISLKDGSLVTTVFASTPGRGSEARLLQAKPEGAVRLLAQGAQLGDPVVGPTGDLYVLAVLDDVYQLFILPAEDEAEPLALPPARPAFNSPAIGRDGSVFLALNGLVIGLTAKGEPRWSWTHPQYGDPTQTPPTVIGSPAIGPDGTLFALFQDGLYAFETMAGRLSWRSNYQFVDADRPVHGPMVAPDGTIYVLTRAPAPDDGGEGEAFLYSLRTSGGLNWRWPAGRGVPHPPAVGADGTVYLPVTQLRLPDESIVGRLYALNADSTQLRPPVERAPELGMIEAVVLDNAGALYALAPLDTETLILGFRPDGAELFPTTPVPGRLRGPLGMPLRGMLSALTDRAMVLLADGPVLDLTMTVDPTAAAPAAELTYTVRIHNSGVLPATNLLLRAGVPASGRYLPGSTLLDGHPIADLADTPPVTGGVNVGLLAPNTTALITFRVALQRASTGAAITNRATAHCDQLGTHVSNTVTTRIN
jgi:uncharacterized repeat protein (TIGR01451 family)